MKLELLWYFILDINGKIYYDKYEPVTAHFDLAKDYGLEESKVAKLVYDPELKFIDEDIGIKGVEKSIDWYTNPLPFPLQDKHLNAIEEFISTNLERSEEYFEQDKKAIESYLKEKEKRKRGLEKLNKLKEDVRRKQ